VRLLVQLSMRQRGVDRGGSIAVWIQLLDSSGPCAEVLLVRAMLDRQSR
jgi:hypothetical protein